MRNKFSIVVRSFVLLLFMLLTVKAHAGGPDYTKAYYPLVNKAELSILNRDYKAALEHYEQAFKAVPTPFARDYYNAAVCAMLLKNKKQSLAYLQHLATKGVSIDYLAAQPVFDSLQTTRQWKKFRKKYPKYRKKYEDQFNLDLRADLDELYARDQYFRQAAGGLRVYADTLQKIEAANVKRLLQWVDKYGYPGESLIGVGDTLEQLPRFSVVIQRQTKARKGYNFSPILEEAVKQGRIRPQVAAFLIEQQVGRSKYGSKAYINILCSNCGDEENMLQTGQYLEERRTEKEMLTIEANRERLGLEPLKDYKKKVLYSMADKRFKLGYTWSVVNYNVPSKEAAEVMMANLMVAEAK